MAEPAFNWRPTVRRRISVAAGLFALWTVVVEARLIFLQVAERERLVALAEKQQLETRTLPAKRGEILDRRGRLLAYSVDADTVYAVPSEIESIRVITPKQRMTSPLAA